MGIIPITHSPNAGSIDCFFQVLQVKEFGKRGRTKYTHLLDQDTTRKEGEGNLQYRIDRRIQDKYMSKRAGVGDDIDGAGRKKAKK